MSNPDSASLIVWLSHMSMLPANDREHDRLEELEDAVVDYLPTISQIATFGCELEFVHSSTQKLLKDPIWSTLRSSTRFNLVVRSCMESLEHKRQLQGASCRMCPAPSVFQPMAQESFQTMPSIRSHGEDMF